jgi:hypothetical protein
LNSVKDILVRWSGNFKFWILLAFTGSLVFVSIARFSDVHHRSNVIVSDTKGYYAYLPAIFIYHDLHFGFNQEIERFKHNETQYTDYRFRLGKGKDFTRYYIGPAIAYSPFFLAAHGISTFMGWDSDGYTPIYHGSLVIAALVYMAFAMFFFGKVLDFFGVKYGVKVFVTWATFFGTNWFYYTVWESGMSHAYSAAVICFFLHRYILYRTKGNGKAAVILGLLLGFIILLRPINVLILLFLPLFHDSFPSFIRLLKRELVHWPRIVYAALGTLAVLSLQAIIYKIQIDQWFIYSYCDERLIWSQPNIGKFLFSIRKGFFVYTVLFTLSIVGLYPWFRRNKYQSLYWIGAMLILVYVLSTWHMWWYGGTLGTRVLIEFYILWAIPLALLLNKLKGYWMMLVFSLACLFIINNMLQYIQYRSGILHWDSMNWQLYKDIFLYPIIP